MPINDLLSICIPTFNRAELLRGCLKNIIPQAREHEIPIYISDNASTDNTKEIVSSFRSIYQHVYYSCNPQNIEDDNFERVLKMSKSKYSWLFGDRVRLLRGAMAVVLEQLKQEDYDLIVVNALARPPRVMENDVIGSTLYTDQNKLLGDIGWWMTFVGASIWNADIIKNGKFKKYSNTNFTQIGVMFEYLSGKNIRVFWNAEPLIYSTGESGWYKKAFEIFVEKWFNLVQSLPPIYTDEAKKKCIKDLNTKNSNFSVKGFLMFRSMGQYDLNVYKKYGNYFRYVSNVPKYILFLIAFIPPIPAVIITFLKKVRDFYHPKPT